jgi:Cu/Zn superoxide dismutase
MMRIALTPARAAAPSPMTHVRTTLVTIAIALLASACSSTSSWDPRRWFGRDEAPSAAPREVPGAEARLRGIGSAANGMVRVRETADLLIVQVEIAGLTTGTYRVVFHETPNCSSPNGFSAGAPWASPGARTGATQLIPLMNVGTEGRGDLVARLRGVKMGEGGMLNRSVLIYDGTTIEPLKPGVPNNVVACGVFVKATSLF